MSNPFAVTKASTLAAEAVGNRAAQEVQAALVIAKKYPRDENTAYEAVMQACKLKTVAENAQYEFSRGGTPISGPTIDLLETVCRCWGNCQTGVVELDRRNGESVVMAFAWDLQTNYYDQKAFTVKHRRDTKEGGYELKDERDIYEAIANQGARRKRACMEAIVPRFLIDDAIAQCEKTLKTNAEPIIERVKKMLEALAKFGVNQAMIEKRLQHNLDAITENELVRLRKIFLSLRDGASDREDWFKSDEPVSPKGTVTPKPDAVEEAKQGEQGLGPVKPIGAVSPSAPASVAESPPSGSLPPHSSSQAAPISEPRKRRSKATLVEEPLDPPPPTPSPEPAAQSATSVFQPIGDYDVEDTPSVTSALRAGILRDGFTEPELMAYLVGQGLAKPSQKSLENLHTKKLDDICKRWPEIAAELQVERLGPTS